MEDLVCAHCVIPGRLPDGRMVNMNRPMELVRQFSVQGRPTCAWHCMGCNGRINTQLQTDPGTGQPRWVPMNPRATEEEYRPQAVRLQSQERLQIQAAYSLGSSPASAANRELPPLPAPEKAYSLDPSRDAPLPPGHPMHPDQIRARMQPVRY